MSVKARHTAGLVLIWLVGLALVASAIFKMARTEELAAEMGESGFAELLFPLAVLEILCAGLLLVPLTRRVGLLMCTAYLGGAIATHVGGDGLGEAIAPAVLQALLWVGSALHTPDLLGPLLTGGVPTKAVPTVGNDAGEVVVPPPAAPRTAGPGA